MPENSETHGIAIRLAQMNRDLLYLVKRAEKRGFATEDEKKQMTVLRRNIAQVKAGGDFIYEPGSGEE